MVENPILRPPLQAWKATIERSKGRPHLREWQHSGDSGIGEGKLTYMLPPEAYGQSGDA
jgi:hypothetical protein